jgi:single-strand selective monofunctional uracil DNA glycosylase
LEPSGRNKTPDKLPKEERNRLQEACDIHLKRVIEITGAEYLIGIGKYAEKAFIRVAGTMGKTIASILHPSPANPAANRGWGEQASKHLEALGVWVCE